MQSRRAFFRRMMGEAVSAADELRGRPQLRLSDISKLDDESLMELVPMVRPDVEVLDNDQGVCARLPQQEENVVLFSRDERIADFMFTRFDGQTTLRCVCDELVFETEWDEAEAFARVKAFFLRLLDMGVCVPGNPGV